VLWAAGQSRPRAHRRAITDGRRLVLPRAGVVRRCGSLLTSPYYPSMELRYRVVLAALFIALVGALVFLFTYAAPGPGATD
jgi:hypothetical protein